MSNLTQWIYFNQDGQLDSFMSLKENIKNFEPLGEPVYFENLDLNLQFALNLSVNKKYFENFKINNKIKNNLKFKISFEFFKDDNSGDKLFGDEARNFKSLNIMWEFSKNIYQACEQIGFNLEQIKTQNNKLILTVLSLDVLKNQESAFGLMQSFVEISALARGFKLSNMAIKSGE